MTDKDTVLAIVRDSVADLLYYDRKEDEDCPIGAIDSMVTAGDITVDEIVAEYRAALEKGLEE